MRERQDGLNPGDVPDSRSGRRLMRMGGGRRERGLSRQPCGSLQKPCNRIIGGARTYGIPPMDPASSHKKMASTSVRPPNGRVQTHGPIGMTSELPAWTSIVEEVHMDVLATSTGASHCERSYMHSVTEYIQLARGKLCWEHLYLHQNERLFAPEPLPQRLCKITPLQFPVSFPNAPTLHGSSPAKQLPYRYSRSLLAGPPRLRSRLPSCYPSPW